MRSFIFIAACVAVLNANPAFAEEASGEDAVRIMMDQRAKAFIFIIDDEPVAMIDKKGLHVPGEVNYGMSLTDTGPDFIRKNIALQGKEGVDD